MSSSNNKSTKHFKSGSSSRLASLLEEFVEDVISEMPIAAFKTVGNFDKATSAFSHKVDRTILTNPVSVEKIKRQWQKTPFVFDLYFINDKRVGARSVHREIGEIDLSYLRDRMEITEEEIPDPEGNSITVIYTGNFGAERYMASSWILAHRVGHALRRSSTMSNDGVVGDMYRLLEGKLASQLSRILQTIYNVSTFSDRVGMPDGIHYSNEKYWFRRNEAKLMKWFSNALGTMKSARDNNLRNEYEFVHELLAQYIITGTIKLNSLTESVLLGYLPYGREHRRYVRNKEALEEFNSSGREDLENFIKNGFDEVLNAAMGGMFVI